MIFEMENILQEIYNHKLQEVRARKKKMSTQEICDQIDCDRKPINFAKALQNKINENKNALICEVKKASPSKGIICPNFNNEQDAVKLAKIYENSGAAAISVLTDEKYFMGSDNYLKAIKSQTNLPLLRKDFIIDKYQIYESKMLGADCILLIVAMLNDQKLIELEEVALNSGLSVLIEVHNQQEIDRALKNLKSPLIGINNRNLKNFKTNVNISIELSKQIPQNKIIISESAINSKENIRLLNKNSINSFLIGEFFMRQNNIKESVEEFVNK